MYAYVCVHIYSVIYKRVLIKLGAGAGVGDRRIKRESEAGDHVVDAYNAGFLLDSDL